MPRRFIIFLILFTLPGCTLATVRSLEEDEEAKAGFDPDRYVEGIWDDQVIPTIQENAVDVNELLSELDNNEEAAIAQYGNRSSEGSSYSFMIRGTVRILEIDRSSSIGRMNFDLQPYDGEADGAFMIGPVISRRNIALRDAVGFIDFNDFVNQVEFGGVASALNDRMLVTVIEPLDLDSFVGQDVNFLGAFGFDDRSDLEIVPISLEVAE